LKHVGANSVTSVTAYVILYSYIQVHKLVQIKSIDSDGWFPPLLGRLAHDVGPKCYVLIS